MQAAKVEFHRLADKDFEGAFKFYAERSADAAQHFKEAVGAAVQRIAESPDSFPTASGQYRWVRVRGFRYILVFRRRGPDDIVVAAVAHISRRPGYWRRRQ